jgi:hypothetical protein
MVARGMRFSNGFVATPVCGPAWGSWPYRQILPQHQAGEQKGCSIRSGRFRKVKKVRKFDLAAVQREADKTRSAYERVVFHRSFEPAARTSLLKGTSHG